MNAVITSDVPGASLVPANLGEAVRFAEVMAQGRLVPKHLQGSPGDCLMVIEQAARWRMSPFAVAQATSVISGKMMFEGKLVAAAVETSGAIVGHLDYTFDGDGENRSITVSATRRGETNPRTVTVMLKDARTNNEMWKRQPDQQLVYHGARVWARRWTPAVILGVYSREEMGPVIEGEVVSDERAAINEAVPLRAAAAATPRPERVVDPTVYDTPAPQPQKLTWSQWGDSLEVTARETPDDALGRVLARAEVGEIKRLAEQGAYSPAKARILEAIREMEERYNAYVKQPSDDLPGADADSPAEPAHA